MSRSSAYGALFAGLVLVSTAGPFLVAAKMDAYVLSTVRLFGGAAIFLAWAVARGELRLPKGSLPALLGGSALFAAHLLLWVKAFDLTDFASNLLLLVAQPVIAAGLGALLGERHGRDTLVSLALALVGLAIIARGDFELGPRALLGDALCLLACLAIALFYVVTRRLRDEAPLSAFLGVTFGLGGLLALPVALASGASFSGYPPGSWAWATALIVLTTVAGHGLMNYAARHVRLFTLNVVIVLEPAIGIALGAVLFGAGITSLQLAGGLVLAASVAFGLRPELRSGPADARAAA